MSKLYLIFLPFILISATTASNSFIYAGCSQSKYATNSAYEFNVDSLLSSLASASTNSSFTKLTSASATPSSTVYGLFQCRGDLDPSACNSCVHSALSRLSSLCAYSSAAALQLDACLLRYDNQSFLGKPDSNLLFKKCGPTPPIGYDASIIGMRDDALEAIESAGGTAGGTYRVGAAGYVQAAAQCVGDLSAKDCADCVKSAVEQVKSVCGDAVSGEVYLGKCFAKYYSTALYPYSPSSSSSNDDNNSHHSDHHGEFI